MDDTIEKRMADTYEITQAIRIGGKEVAFGIDETREEPYFCAFYNNNGIFEQYTDCMVGNDYAEMIKFFGQRVQEQADKVIAEQKKVTVEISRISAEDCFYNNHSQSIEGKVIAIKADSLAPEYRIANYQLMLITGGNGSRANALGSACFCTNLYTGERERWERYDVQGEVKPEKLPSWAKERLMEIQREQAEKERERELETAQKDHKR